MLGTRFTGVRHPVDTKLHEGAILPPQRKYFSASIKPVICWPWNGFLFELAISDLFFTENFPIKLLSQPLRHVISHTIQLS